MDVSVFILISALDSGSHVFYSLNRLEHADYHQGQQARREGNSSCVWRTQRHLPHDTRSLTGGET